MTRISPRISITLPNDLHSKIKSMAKKQHRSISAQIAHLTEMGINLSAEQDRVLRETSPRYLTKKDDEDSEDRKKGRAEAC